jgi:uncharacterized delta-60 repeat protein
MKRILVLCLILTAYSAHGQFLGSITPGIAVYDYKFGSAIELNNGNLLFVNSIHHNQFNKVHNLYAAGGFFAPQTPQTPNSIPVLIKHMIDDRYVVATFHDNNNVLNIDTLEISRHNPDGSYDSSFNNNGRYFRVINTNNDQMLYPYDLIVLKDSSLIMSFATASGFVDFKVRALKLKPNGSLDSTFGTNGIISPPLNFIAKPPYNIYFSGSVPMLEDNNNHIYFAGSKNYKKCLIRYNQFGVFDSSYGYKISADTGDISRLILDYSGDIYAVGCNTSVALQFGLEPFEWFVRKYKPDGTLNAAFGTNGEFTLPAYQLSNAFLQADGKMILFGQSSNKGNILGKRIHDNGILDTSFSVNSNYLQCGNFQQNFVSSSLMQTNGNVVYMVGFVNNCSAEFHVNRILNNPCGNGNVVSSLPSLTASNINLCPGVLSADTVFISGNLNAASYWEYYTDQNPTPVQVYGNSFNISPAFTTTYYVRGAGYCSGNGPADSITITVNPPSVSYTNTTLCINQIPYTWNGITIDSQGVYTALLTDINGCDSVATLNLNISVCGLCQNGFTANWSPFTDSLVESSTWITTSGTVLIPLGAKVKFDANVGGYVRLNPVLKQTQAPYLLLRL